MKANDNAVRAASTGIPAGPPEPVGSSTMMSAVTLFAGHYPLDDIAASNDAEPEHRGSAASYRKNSTAPLSSRGEAMPSKAIQAIKPSILANENILL